MSWAGVGAITGILALAVGGGTAIYQADQASKAGKASRKAADDASQKNIGNLTGDEAQSASKKLFRKDLYFTSPTGINSGSGTRGRSRLMGT